VGKAQASPIRRVFASIAASGGADADDFNSLFDGGLCPNCHAPGPRSTKLIRYHRSSRDRFNNGCLVKHELRVGPTLQLFSEPFLSLLTDEERSVLTWRPTEDKFRGPLVMHELAGSDLHLRLARLRDGTPDDSDTCSICGWAEPPSYPLSSMLPAWIEPHLHVFHDFDVPAIPWPPTHFLNDDEIPDPTPPCFTVGDWRGFVMIILPVERWNALRRSRYRPGISAWPLPSIAPEHVV
jgi:hypothetical protein